MIAYQTTEILKKFVKENTKASNITSNIIHTVDSSLHIMLQLPVLVCHCFDDQIMDFYMFLNRKSLQILRFQKFITYLEKFFL